MIIDSHCHLDYEPMFSNLDDVLSRALKKNINYMLTISTTDESFLKILFLIKKYKNIFGTYGIHPHEADKYEHLTIDNIIKKIGNNKKILGIGETGLDFYYENSKKKIQTKLFKNHIRAAQELNLPVIIHTRAAEDETLEVIKSEKKIKDFKALIHCFTGSNTFAHKLIDLGCFISASGIVTFKKSISLAKTFSELPVDKILVETDSPYLSPEPLRGRSNEPSNIVHTVEFLSKIKNINYDNLSKITTENFFSLFGRFNEK